MQVFLVVDTGIEPVTFTVSRYCSTTELINSCLVVIRGNDPLWQAYETRAYPSMLYHQLGVLDGERSHTIAFTEQCADHYTTNTID